MKRIVINRSYDEFCISHQALIRLRALGNVRHWKKRILEPIGRRLRDRENRA